jgi:hypothetical protein
MRETCVISYDLANWDATSRYEPAPVIRRIVMCWTLGFVIASVLVATVSSHFISSLAVYEWSPELGDYVFKAGYVQRKRDEGWATSHYGLLGFNGPTDTGNVSGSHLLIWGDSFVEAHQVDDEQKMAHQLNEALAHDGSPLRAVTIGHSLWSISDYYFRIPRYEGLLNATCHFIVIAERGLKDLCPDGETFLSKPAFHFVRRSLVDAHKSKTIAGLNEWGLSDMLLAPWKAVRTLVADGRNMRFSPGPCRPVGMTTADSDRDFLPAEDEPNSVVEAWSYALDMLKAQTSRPIVLVLVPEVPRLDHGVVCCVDSQVQWRAKLVELCKVKQVGCIDMTEALVDDYRTTGALSRGFHNGRPGSGHLNARGHWLVSQQIYAYLKAHRESQ